MAAFMELAAQFLPLAAVFGVMYFFVVRPQQQKAKAHQEKISSLKVGDEVITSGGIHGTVDSLMDVDVMLRIAPDTVVRVRRTAISDIVQKR